MEISSSKLLEFLYTYFCFRQNLGLYFFRLRKLMCHKNVWYWIFYYMVLCCIFMLSICTVEFILIWFYTRYGILWHHFHKSQNRKETSQFVGVCCDVVLGKGLTWPSWPCQASQCTTLPGSSLFRCLSLDEESHGWCNFMLFSSWRRSRWCNTIAVQYLLRRKFQQRYPKTVHVFFLVHYEST